jgi:hypothetical protein
MADAPLPGSSSGAAAALNSTGRPNEAARVTGTMGLGTAASMPQSYQNANAAGYASLGANYGGRTHYVDEAAGDDFSLDADK